MAIIDEPRMTLPVPYAVTNPERIPKQRYYDQEFFDLERKHFWTRAWQMACRLEEIPNVGDWVEYRNLDISALVVRTGPDTVKAFDNACRHRGARLGVGSGNCARSGFICPFHGWCYDKDGTNTHVYKDELFSPEQLERDQIDLQEYSVDTWAGSVFVNPDRDAPPLRDHLGILPQYLDARNIDEMRTVRWNTVELPCNWKLTLEAFFESYHLKTTHPQLLSHGRVDTYGKSTDNGQMFDAKKSNMGDPTIDEWVENQINYMNLLTQGTGYVFPKDVDVARSLKGIDLPEDPEERTDVWQRELNDAITRSNRAAGATGQPDINGLPKMPHMVFFAFPNFHVVTAYGNAVLTRVRPLTAETCKYEIWRISHGPEPTEEGRVKEPTFVPYDSGRWEPVLQQDFDNLPLQQDGMHRPGFEYMRLSRDVEGRLSSLHRTIDAYIAGLPPELTVPAASIASGHSDVPVVDLGLGV